MDTMYFPQDKKILSVTGHRPQSIDSDFDYHTDIWVDIYEWYGKIIETGKFDYVLSGMALGVDTVAARAAVEAGVPLVACVPFVGQQRRWTKRARERYDWLTKRAEEVVYVDKYYEIVNKANVYYKLQKRNEFMVDNSTLLAATWNGVESGGTWNCLRYAGEAGREVRVHTPIGYHGSQGLYK